jgi:molybdopterin-guanine dinucleotide biosynthesis protein A
MGGADKATILLLGRPLLTHVMARLAPQVAAMAVSANGDPGRLAAFGVPVLADPTPGRPGPLAGILAALAWAREQGPEIADLLVAPVDTPFLPADLRARLEQARAAAGARLAIAASGGRTHPTVALLPVAAPLEADLASRLARGERRVGAFFAAHGAAIADYGDDDPDPFRNLNTPEDFAAAEAIPGRPDVCTTKRPK